MTWITIILALIPVFIKLYEWFKNRAERAAAKLPPPSSYATPEEGVDALFGQMRKEARGPLQKLAIWWMHRVARRQAAKVMAGQPITLTPEDLEEVTALAGAESGRAREVREKIEALAADPRFEGDARKMFDAYDEDDDGSVNREELTAICYDAGIGSGITRWRYVKGIVDELDADRNGKVSWEEFEQYAT